MYQGEPRSLSLGNWQPRKGEQEGGRRGREGRGEKITDGWRWGRAE